MKIDEEKMKELSAGVQKIFQDAVKGTPSLQVETKKIEIQPDFSRRCVMLHTTLSTYSQEGRKEGSGQETKGGGI